MYARAAGLDKIYTPSRDCRPTIFKSVVFTQHIRESPYKNTLHC
jgi:hypothetical protein